jgi:flagellar hook-associated protein 2
MALSTPISVSGLSSGLDTEALIEKLNEANSLKVRRLQTQKSNIETTRTAFTTLGEKLNTLLAKAETLAKEQTYDAKTVTVSKPDDLSVTSTTSGISGNYAISEYQRSTQSRLTGKNGISNGSLSLTTS